MRASTSMMIALVALIAASSGCRTITSTVPPAAFYAAPTSPESVLVNLEKAFERKDLAEYNSILSQDYVFRFRPEDVVPGQGDFAVRAQEMACMDDLFHRGSRDGLSPADEIRLTLTMQSAEDDPRPGHEGWKKIAVSTHAVLIFGLDRGMLITDPSTLYFKREPAPGGPWKLAEWLDQPPGDPSWGQLRKMFQ